MRRAGRDVQLRRWALAAFLAAGCTTGDDAPAADAAAAPDTIAPADAQGGPTQTCTNAEAGFRVDYPADWHTNDGSVMPACSLFDPQPITVPPASEIPQDIAVSIGREQVAFGVAAGEDIGRRVLTADTTRIDGRTAVRMESEATGEGLYDAGMLSYSWVVDLDDAVLIAQSHDAGEPDFAAKKSVLDRMMQSLRITGDR